MKLHHIFENSIEHEKALKHTGFWGQEGAGALVFAMDTRRFLIGHRSSQVEQPYTWGTFGGAMDRGENAKQAAIRETEEETGLSESNIVNTKLVYTFQDENTNFQYHNFIIVVESEFKPTLNWENEEAEWFACNEFPSPEHFGLLSLMNSSGFRSFVSKYCR